MAGGCKATSRGLETLCWDRVDWGGGTRGLGAGGGKGRRCTKGGGGRGDGRAEGNKGKLKRLSNSEH